ncbi:hypothetical protein TRAPUB_3451 [Trametes pubescens]|uniref:F-box domain-containing protein n=1 Tax=Trametes pubescens TaxID=154538 RepID=A0A1M2VDW8_TRAPU|nr:hypothetical protein TRAPUB_3451 [Trametes pubescens]
MFSVPYYGAQTPEGLSSDVDYADPLQRAQLVVRARAGGRDSPGLYALINAATPVGQLPPEILIEIFLYLKTPPSAGWEAVLLVCRRWFYIAATTGALWTHLKIGGRTNLLYVGLARSRSPLVDVEVLESAAHLTKEVLDALAPYTHRLRSLKLRRMSADLVFWLVRFVMENALPALRCLEAHSEDRSNEDTPPLIGLFPDRFPSLAELRCSNIFLFNPTLTFTGLRVFEVSGYSGPPICFVLRILIYTIRVLERIEVLTLTDVNVIDPEADVSQEDRVILWRLCKLLRLLLDARISKQLLSNIALWHPAPDVSVASLYRPGIQDDEECFQRLLPNDPPICLPALTNLVRANVRVLPSSCSIEGYTSYTPEEPPSNDEMRGHIKLEVGRSPDGGNTLSLGGALRILSELRVKPPLEELRIEFSPAAVKDLDWRSALASFSELRSLSVVLSGTIETETAHLEQILDVLHSPPAQASVENDAVLPELQRLRLSGFLSDGGNGGLLPRVVSVLENRRHMLGREVVLEELSLDLDGHETNEAFEQAKETFAHAVTPFVAHFVYSRLGCSAFS